MPIVWHKQYNFIFHFFDNDDIYNTLNSINEEYKCLIYDN